MDERAIVHEGKLIVGSVRPIAPKWPDPRTALVWMRGTYQSDRGQWTTAVVATILPAAPGLGD